MSTACRQKYIDIEAKCTVHYSEEADTDAIRYLKQNPRIIRPVTL